jgi:hypothetical protein
MKSLNTGWKKSALLSLVAAVSVLNTSAQWGSIRYSNRDHGQRAEPRERAESREHVEAREHTERREAPERGRAIVGEYRRPEERRYDIDEDRYRGYYWSNYHPGLWVNTLPPGYQTFNIGGTPYYYYQGVYYQNGPSGYSVVAPPAGVVLPALPPGAEAVAANGGVYYYVGGTFYVQQPNGFTVVPPPIGVTVGTLPPGAVPVTMNGMVYYQAGGIYYLPVMQNGVTAFMTVAP